MNKPLSKEDCEAIREKAGHGDHGPQFKTGWVNELMNAAYLSACRDVADWHELHCRTEPRIRSGDFREDLDR
jgi:hypothetical protein